ncbi:MAG: hypothetical protein ACRD28_12890 [Acidobacteriaceae bacterium]
MRCGAASLLTALVLAAASLVFAESGAHAQSGSMVVPTRVVAGSAFSIPTSGSGKAVLYIVGPSQVLRRDVQLGQAVSFAAGDLYNAGRYLAVLTGGASSQVGQFNVVPAAQPESLSFLAKPSRLPVGQHNGISGTAYVFDAYGNLITAPMSVSFELSDQSEQSKQAAPVQSQTVTTRNGVAWTQMNSAEKQGRAKFVAQVDGASSTRIIQQVPGKPCGLTMSARPAGQRIELQTAPLRDCAGNPVTDGTIVTFTENCHGAESTVDAPLKQGIARVDMPACDGATISVASGVVAGNEIHWKGGK